MIQGFFKCVKSIQDLDIPDYVPFCSCNKPFRNIDYLTLDVPFGHTETFKDSFFTWVYHAWNNKFITNFSLNYLISVIVEGIFSSYFLTK